MSKIDTKQQFISLVDNCVKNETLQAIREKAVDTFSQMQFPTKRHEEWKYTNINPIVEKSYSISQQTTSISQEQIDGYLLGQEAQNILVFRKRIILR